MDEAIHWVKSTEWKGEELPVDRINQFMAKNLSGVDVSVQHEKILEEIRRIKLLATVKFIQEGRLQTLSFWKAKGLTEYLESSILSGDLSFSQQEKAALDEFLTKFKAGAFSSASTCAARFADFPTNR